MLNRVFAGLVLAAVLLLKGTVGWGQEGTPAEVAASTPTVSVSSTVLSSAAVPSPLASAWEALSRGDTRTAGRLASN